MDDEFDFNPDLNEYDFLRHTKDGDSFYLPSSEEDPNIIIRTDDTLYLWSPSGMFLLVPIKLIAEE